jgi:hypothetical protein
MMRGVRLMIFIPSLLILTNLQETSSHGDHPLSRIAIHEATLALTPLAYVEASPSILGLTTVSFLATTTVVVVSLSFDY